MANKSEIAKIEPEIKGISPMELLSNAISTGVSTDQLERLMNMQERYAANKARAAFGVAIAKAKAEIPVIRKNRNVGFGKTRYNHEDLAEIARTVDPILSEYGLSYRFKTSNDAGAVTVTCIISHVDGHSEENQLSAALDKSGAKNDIQALGSAVTYLQRYTLKAGLGLASSEDTDGATRDDGDSPISDAQLSDIVSLADDVGVDKIKFCKYFRIDSLADLRKSQFANAKAAIEKKRKS